MLWSLLHFHSPAPPRYPPPNPLQVHSHNQKCSPFFQIIIITCIYMYVYTQMYINNTCPVCFSYFSEYDFKADSSVLENQSGSSYLEVTSFPSLNSHQFSVVLCLGVGHNIPFPTSVSIELAIVPVLFMKLFLRKTSTAEFLVLWLLQSFSLLFHDVP